MKHKLLLAIMVVLLGLYQQSIAQSTTQKEESQTAPSSERIFQKDIPYSAGEYKPLQFYAYFINQFVSTNMYPESSLYNGQLVGRLFGANSSSTSATKTSFYAEQRLIPFFIYTPKLFNGKALLRASFEIDWTWGDQAYGIGGNKGGALSGDQVNIQTQNIEIELIPAKGWAVNMGLQRLYDTPFNPYRTFFEKMTYSSYRLAYWGSDAVGVSVRRNTDLSKMKFGYYKLYENLQEIHDDVTLLEASFRRKLPNYWNVGVSMYAIIDRGKNTGGVSVYGQGLTSTLVTLNGGYKFDFGTNDYTADIAWLGTYFSRNPDFIMDRVQLSGFFNYNLGKVNVVKEGWEQGVDVGGFGLNARAAYRYGQTVNDYVSFDYVYSTGDENGISDGNYTGVITGNTWGLPASIFISSGSYLLFPHGNVVNRFTPAVADLSNMGYGLNAFTVNAHHDLIPHKLNVKIGGAQGFSNIIPQGGGANIGTEINAAVKYQLGVFMSVELHAANLWLGDFYDSNDATYSSDINGSYNNRPPDPWTVFLVYKWLIF
ncbi:MAG: hypothetical protein B7C24_06090 [Bacteroidetes bacterium 4572_77]|nr:MAG: hypothetical protein B7C24_06090 [Bacteroidetes bacterium 4572_77]